MNVALHFIGIDDMENFQEHKEAVTASTVDILHAAIKSKLFLDRNM